MTTIETIQKIFANRFALAPERVQPEVALEALGLDSLDSIEVLFDIEDAFQIRIPQDRSAEVKLVLVKDLIELIDHLVSQQQPTRATG
jgi:acyl carrier protein